MSLFQAVLMSAVLLVLSLVANFSRSTKVKSWGVLAMFLVVSIPPGAVIVNSVLEILGL